METLPFYGVPCFHETPHYHGWVIPDAPFSAPQKRALLLGLIRWTGALIALASALSCVYFVAGILIDAFHGQMGSLGWIGVPIVILITVVILGLLAKIGYDMFRMDYTNAVPNFVCTISIFFAWDVYHLLPQQLPVWLTGFDAHKSDLYPHAAIAFNRSTKELMALVAAYLFYRIAKAMILRILDVPGSSSFKRPTPPSSFQQFNGRIV